MNYRAVVITVSDSCFQKQRTDHSGPALSHALAAIGIEIAANETVPDERKLIAAALYKYCKDPAIHLICTTGGTGFGPRDVTPEGTRDVIERPAPGIAELLRKTGASQTPLSWLSRGEAGIAAGKLIINLPGSPRAMASSVDTLRPILFHALDLINGAKPH